MKKFLNIVPLAIIALVLGFGIVYLTVTCKAQNEETFRVVKSLPACDDDVRAGPCDTGLPGECADGFQFCTEDCQTGEITCDECTPDFPELCSPQ